MGSKSIVRVTPERESIARSNITPYTVRTPLIPLGNKLTRPDHPSLQIYIKLETLQPCVGSFKIRGAANAIASRKSELERMEDPIVVTASAGNMGQGVAHACREFGYSCIVVVPDSAPRSKVDAMVEGYGATVIHVPYNEWWGIIETSDCSDVEGIGDKAHVFIHPVCDQAVVEGNSTCGSEILEEMPDVDAIFVPYGGGGLSCGIGSAVMNHHESSELSSLDGRHKCTVVSCEPETAAPMALSRSLGVMSSFASYYEPSFCDGCGGKAVLPAMWPLAQLVIDQSVAVPLHAIEAGVWTLHERTKVVAEGAGGVTVGAAMFCPLERLGPDARSWKKVVCVVGGSGIDRGKLCEILQRFDGVGEMWDMAKKWNWAVRGSEEYTAAMLTTPLSGEKLTQQLLATTPSKQGQLTVLSGEELTKRLPMNVCIKSAHDALVALHNKSGLMPLRQVHHLPRNEINNQIGLLVTMPSYLNGYAACKVFTVYPDNDFTKTGYSSHNGIVALFHAKHHGEVALLADAHMVTSIRTAAASAVATKVLAREESSILAILGTGEQANAHFVSMLETGLPFMEVRLWGRNKERAKRLEDNLKKMIETYRWVNQSLSSLTSKLDFRVCHTVEECVKSADVICTVVPSIEPVLKGEWVKPGAHINAVGACLPTQRELNGACVANAQLYCDSKEACFVEAGDVVMALKEGSITKKHLKGEIGAVLCGDLIGREDDEQITLFKSLGIALEDLAAARAVYESGEKS